MTTLQKTLVALTITAAVGTGIHQARRASALQTRVQQLQEQLLPLTGQIQQLEQERDVAKNRLIGMTDEMNRGKSNSSELLRLRGEVGKLRKENQELASAGMPKTNSTLLSKGFGTLGEYLPLANVSDEGTGTPEALLQTWLWAMREGNVARLEQLDAPFAGQSALGDVAGEISKSNSAAFNAFRMALTNAAGFHLSSKFADDAQSCEVHLDAEPLGHGENEGDMKLNGLSLSFIFEEKGGVWVFGDHP